MLSVIVSVYSGLILLFRSSYALPLDMVKDGTLVKLQIMHVV